jgi:hypothetical protein
VAIDFSEKRLQRAARRAMAWACYLYGEHGRDNWRDIWLISAEYLEMTRLWELYHGKLSDRPVGAIRDSAFSVGIKGGG